MVCVISHPSKVTTFVWIVWQVLVKVDTIGVRYVTNTPQVSRENIQYGKGLAWKIM